MPNLPTIQLAPAYFACFKSFGIAAAAASLTNSQLKTTATDATSGTLNITRYNMPFAGSLITIAWAWSATIAGTFTLTPTINGNAVTDSALIVSASSAQFGYVRVDAQRPLLRWALTSTPYIGLQITTTSGFTGTPDGQFELGVCYEGVEL